MAIQGPNESHTGGSKFIVTLTLAMVAIGMLASGCSYYNHHPRGRGHYKKFPGPVVQVSTPAPRVAVRARTPNGTTISMVFNDRQRRIITDYYHSKYKGKRGKWKNKGKWKNRGRGRGRGLPPGLAKKDRLPPGIRKQMLPRDLITQLPPPSPGTQVIIHNNQVVLMEVNTRIILDVIDLDVSVRF